jgi:hypothetical protein
MKRYAFALAAALWMVFFASPANAQVVSLLVGNESGFPGLDRYDANTGLYAGTFGVVGSGSQFSYFKYGGPSMDLFVLQGNNVLRFNGHSGNFISNFITAPGAQFAFGPDNNLYRLEPFSQTQFFPAGIGKYDGATGARLATFVPAGSSGITVATGGMRFAPNGNLYVDNDDRMLGFNGTTGAPLGPFFTPGTSGLGGMGDALFASNGNLIVSALGSASNRLYRFDGTTGAYLGVFASGNGLDVPIGLAEAANTNIYVASSFADQILRFDLTTGTFLGPFVSNTAHMGPAYLAFTPFPVPEPSSFILAGIAGLGVAGRALLGRADGQ